MSRTCETCGRSWDGRATFCGACGALLDDRVADARADAGGLPWWRRPVVGGLGVALAAVGAVIAVPTLSIDRTTPVDGEVGVPDADGLQPAPADARVRRSVAPPRVECLRGDVEVDCVLWSRALATPPGPRDEAGAWVMPAGDRVLVVTDDRVEAADAVTGTRLWQVDPPGDGHDGQGQYPVGLAGDDGLVLAGRHRTTVVDLDDGSPRWTVDTGAAVWGLGADAGVVLAQSASGGTGTTLAAHDVADGDVRWTWDAPWFDLHVVPGAGSDRIVVVSAAGDGLAVLDRTTGHEVSRSEGLSTAWVVGVLDDVAVIATPLDGTEASGPGLVGDSGATLRGIGLDDGAQRWQHDVRAGNHGVALVGGLVVVPSTQRLTAIDARTGTVAWDVPTDGSEFAAAHGSFWSPSVPPAVDRVHTVVTVDPSGSRLRGRSPESGTLWWEQEVDGGVQHASVDGDRVIVFAGDGYHLHDPASGDHLLQVRASAGSPVGTDPFLLHHHGTGYVTRLDVDGVPHR